MQAYVNQAREGGCAKERHLIGLDIGLKPHLPCQGFDFLMGGISEIADFDCLRVSGFNLALDGFRNLLLPVFFNHAKRSPPILFYVFLGQVIAGPFMDLSFPRMRSRSFVNGPEPINFCHFGKTISNEADHIFTVVDVLLKCLAIDSPCRAWKALSSAWVEIHLLLRKQCVAQQWIGQYFEMSFLLP